MSSELPDSALLKEMLRQVRAATFDTQAETYTAAFNAAAATNKPLPCPYCFCQGNESALEHLPSRGGFGAVICNRCKSRFAFMDEHQAASTSSSAI